MTTLIGVSGYNPPKFVTDAAKAALDRVECNQYSPTKVQQQAFESGLATDGRLGTAKAKEGSGGCILSFLRQEDRSRHRGHDHDWGERGHAECFHGLH